ncbi:hypothetical protein ACJZ2D_016557 [Fusarium nematophilum]
MLEMSCLPEGFPAEVPEWMDIDTDVETTDVEMVDAVGPADRNGSWELPDGREDQRLMSNAVNGGFAGRSPNLDSQVTERFSQNEIDQASQLAAAEPNAECLSTNVQGPRAALMTLMVEARWTPQSGIEMAISNPNIRGLGDPRNGDVPDADGDFKMLEST